MTFYCIVFLFFINTAIAGHDMGTFRLSSRWADRCNVPMSRPTAGVLSIIVYFGAKGKMWQAVCRIIFSFFILNGCLIYYYNIRRPGNWYSFVLLRFRANTVRPYEMTGRVRGMTWGHFACHPDGPTGVTSPSHARPGGWIFIPGSPRFIGDFF